MTDEVKPLSNDEVVGIAAITSVPDLDGRRFVTMLADQRDSLCATVRALHDELERRERTMKFWEESYLAEHETWGNCQWKAENTALREQLAQSQTHLREQRETIKFWQRHIARMGKLLGTVAMDTEVEEAVKRLQLQLAQVTQERDRLQVFVTKTAGDGCLRGRSIHCIENEPNSADWCITCQAKALRGTG